MNKSDSKDPILLKDVCSADSGLSIVESAKGTPVGEYTGAVLATLDGPVMDYKIPTRNERLYEEDLCDEVANSDYVKELIDTKNFLGEADHPMRCENRLDIHYPYISHAIRNFRKVPEKGCYYATFDILDTPNGRILKTLIDYGTQLGVSSRGSGTTITKNGKTVVDKDSYRFITFDIVCMPGNKVARLPTKSNASQVIESTEYDNSLTLTEQVNSLIDLNDIDALKSIKPVLSYLSESSDDAKSLLDKVNSIFESKESDTITKLDKNDLLDAYRKIIGLKSEISKKDSIINEQSNKLNGLENSLSELQITNAEFKKNLDKSNGLVKAQLESTQMANKKLREVESELERVKSLEDDNTKLNSELDEMSEKLDSYDTRYSKLASKYLSARCSQLGLDSKIVKKSLNESISSYEVDDLEYIIKECYDKKPSYTQANTLNESYPSKVSAKVSSTRRRQSVSSEYDSIVSSCRSVRNI